MSQRGARAPTLPRGWRPRRRRRPAAAAGAARTWAGPCHRDRPRACASPAEQSPCGSEENRHARAHPDRIAGGEVDGAGRRDRILAGLAEARSRGVAALHLAADTGVVLELRLAPLRVGEIQELDAQLDVAPAVLREQVEQVVALGLQRIALVRGTVGEVATAQRDR